MLVVLVTTEDMGADEAGSPPVDPHPARATASAATSVAEAAVPTRFRVLVSGRPISTGPTVTSWSRPSPAPRRRAPDTQLRRFVGPRLTPVVSSDRILDSKAGNRRQNFWRTSW
ncbi:hypothetical protein NIIDNTM18_17820 [Mycolicibacterium litorale]|uniref:Uncharacterized protein n=1 Tax=Mycolicibacterium litorale TaxID=758802 RepID=A0A6S6P184_9MYCO|nr:hypothetical protein NIIDNTM18_17820 [Mycolicibacterium litorale]